MNNFFINIVDGDFFESLGNGKDIVYFPTDNVEEAFNTLENHRVLITHNGDRNIDPNLYDRFKKCGKYEKWFAQNVNCEHDEDLICIPIGLERKRWCRFNKFDVMMKCKETFNLETRNLLYANFSIGTNNNKRAECINTFIGKTYLTNKTQYFLTNTKELKQEQYEEYCNDILSHKFVLCPPGNGLDTHRLWETLYLGRIPVVLHNHVNDSFSDLPILILDKWSEFEDKYTDFNFKLNNYIQKLSQNYWIERIKTT